MAIPIPTKSNVKVKESDEAKEAAEAKAKEAAEAKAKEAAEAEAKEAAEAEAKEAAKVRTILTKLVLANPFSGVRVIPNTPTDHIIVDSWWEAQVAAGLAEWL